MNRNSNLSPLPFYKTIDEQSFRKSYAYGSVYPLIAPKNRFLPFQIVSEDNGTIDNVTVTLSNFKGDVTMDITDAMVEAGLVVKDYDDYNVIVFPGILDKDIWNTHGLDFNNDFSIDDFGGAYDSGEGRAYLIVEYGDSTWYSDVMTLIADVSGCLKVEWYSYSDLVYKGGRIAYNGVAYSNVLYVMREIGMPTYDFSDSGEDRNGYYFATKQISEKTYHFSFLATEPVCDALRIASLSDMVLITDQYGRQYQCDSFLPTPTWQGQGYLASVDCEFQCDTMVVQPSRVIDSSALLPRFFIDGSLVSTVYRIATSGGEFIVYLVPNVAGLSLTSSVGWMTVTHLYDNAYKVTVAPSSGQTITQRSGDLIASSENGTSELSVTQM